MTASIDTLLNKRHIRRLRSGGDMGEALRELPIAQHQAATALPHNRYGRSESISWIN